MKKRKTLSILGAIVASSLLTIGCNKSNADQYSYNDSYAGDSYASGSHSGTLNRCPASPNAPGRYGNGQGYGYDSYNRSNNLERSNTWDRSDRSSNWDRTDKSDRSSNWNRDKSARSNNGNGNGNGDYSDNGDRSGSHRPAYRTQGGVRGSGKCPARDQNYNGNGGKGYAAPRSPRDSQFPPANGNGNGYSYGYYDQDTKDKQASMKKHNPLNIERLTGEIVDKKNNQNPDGTSAVMIILRTGNEDLKVILGPTSYIDTSRVGINIGDKVEVKGSRMQVNGDEMFIASEISKNGNVIPLRDEQGRPIWKQSGTAQTYNRNVTSPSYGANTSSYKYKSNGHYNH